MTPTPARPALTLRAGTRTAATRILRLVTCDPDACLDGDPASPYAGTGLPLASVMVTGSDSEGFTLTFTTNHRKP